MPRRHKQTRHTPYKPSIGDCSNKKRYASKNEAEAVRCEQELLQPGLELRTYRCPGCGAWHLTRQDKV